MKEGTPQFMPDRIAPEALAFDLWLRRGIADRFGFALEPAPDEILHLASRLYR